MIMQPTNLSTYKDQIEFLKLSYHDYIDNDEFSIVKVHEWDLTFPFSSPTFRSDYYSFTIVTNANGSFTVGDDKFELHPNHVVLACPDSYFKIHWTDMEKVYNIAFKKSFILKHFPGGIDNIMEFNTKNGYCCCLTEETMNYFEQTCLEMHKIATSELCFKNDLMANMALNLLFLVQLEKENETDVKINTAKNNKIVVDFRQNIENNFNELAQGRCLSVMRIKEHARLLNLDENYLSKTISAITKKTVNEWINKKLIDEIKYLLKNSEKSMKDIAFLYGFNDLNYFYSFFKTQTQSAPGIYRKLHQNT
ncbi:helix-turn-helix domain-containing protein [Flavobacterium tyrosinilyticum]|uniref:helix-turn-helix domain-containing protein n=1 Tax=Flavobacterium tyrosinilyticum TaxID=1658740 RepID=UPI0020306A15|nr:helix-turn-helix transcriptional regulator [Flavobacterium tyrosinilyticum]MCM0667626.1 helix-turn-helix transcriptional regulator [Flavobacterium tyrosinilyticum]